MSTIVVTGATGNVGRAVADALLAHGHRVRAIVRSEQADVPAGASVVVGDLDRPESVGPALAGADGIFLLAGYQGEQGILDGAVAAGVRRIVLLSGGGAAAADPDNAISRFQLAAEDRVRSAGLAWTILRPHAFFTNVLRWPAVRAGEGVVRAPFADVPIAAIDPGDIGEVAAVALTEDGHADQVYDLSGPESLRPADQVEILDDVLGWQLSFEPLSDDEARAELRADMPAEYVDAFFGFYVDGNLDESAVVPTVEKVVGRPPRRFADWVRGRSGLARRR